MTLEDAFKMLKRPDLLDPEPKKRMFFWYGYEQALVVDKAKPSLPDIGKALGGKKPTSPSCYGRIGRFTGKQGSHELRVAVSGAVPGKLLKDFKAESAKHGLRGIDVVIDEGGYQEDEEAPPGPAPGDAASTLLQKLQALMPDFNKARLSPVAGPRLVELLQKAKKNLDAKELDKAAIHIDNLAALVALALKHGAQSVKPTKEDAPLAPGEGNTEMTAHEVGATKPSTEPHDELAARKRLAVLTPKLQLSREARTGYHGDISKLATLLVDQIHKDQWDVVHQLLDELEKMVDAVTVEIAQHKEFAVEVRKQKNTARAKRLGDVLDGVKSEKYFPKGMAEQYQKEGLKPGKEFQLFLTALKNFEAKYAFWREMHQKHDAKGSPVDQTPFLHDLDEMIGLTQAYLDHYAKDLGADQQNSKESLRKKQVCQTTLRMLQQSRIKAEYESLGHPEGWDLKKENQAAALYAKVLFEEGNIPADKLPSGDSGVSGAWWVEALDFADPKLKNKKKKFIFKPSDAEATIPGFPEGGSAPREVISKVAVDQIQAATGLDFGFPETALVAIDDGKLPDPDKGEVLKDNLKAVLSERFQLEVDPESPKGISEAVGKLPLKADKVFKAVLDALAINEAASSPQTVAALEGAAQRYLEYFRSELKPPHSNEVQDKKALCDTILKTKKPPQRMGSMQHFHKAGKPLSSQRKADPGLLAKIPKEEIQKVAVMDLITLNLDRHPGNFLVGSAPGADGKETPRLVPIDHGLTLPSRTGLDARRSKLQDNAVNMMPGSQEKFTPEMIKKIQMIDADAVVKGMKESLASLKELHPDQAVDQKLPEANFELTRRSIEFMQKAASELAVDEMFDAYAANAEEIFDSPPAEQQEAFAKAIAAAKERSAPRRELNALLAQEKERAKLKTTIEGLGWGADIMRGDFDRWCAMNPKRIMDIYKYKLENPPLRLELDAMLDKLGRPAELSAKIRRKTLKDGRALASAEMKKRGKAMPAVATAPETPPGDVAKTMQEMEAEFPGTTPPDAERQVALARLWREYQRLGGFRVFCRLGGNSEPSVLEPLKNRLDDLRVFKANEDSMKEIDTLDPADHKQNLEGTLAIRLDVVLEGMGRIKDQAALGPINSSYTEALVALDDGKLADSEKALVDAEKLLDPELDKIDKIEARLTDRHEAVLDKINELSPTTPAARKLRLQYGDSLRLADSKDYRECERALTRLEADADEALKAATVTETA